jgi:hypothetical protein
MSEVMTMYTTILWKNGKNGKEKKGSDQHVNVKLSKIKPESLVDSKEIVWKDAEGRPLKQVRKTVVDGDDIFINATENVWLNGETDPSTGAPMEVPKPDRIPYQENEKGELEATEPFETNLKKGAVCDFTKTVSADELENYLYTDVYEITASVEDMWDLYQFAKYLTENGLMAVSNEIVAQAGFKVSGGLITATVDERARTFTMQMRRVTQKIEAEMVNAIPTGPYKPEPKEPKKKAKSKTVF